MIYSENWKDIRGNRSFTLLIKFIERLCHIAKDQGNYFYDGLLLWKVAKEEL